MNKIDDALYAKICRLKSCSYYFSPLYLNFILEQLSDLKDITHREMMGEFILYYREKIFGGIYDNRFLIKPTKTALKYMPFGKLELPYVGAKKMLLVDNVDDKAFLTALIKATYDDLPNKKQL